MWRKNVIPLGSMRNLKSRAIYTKGNHIVEKWSKMIFFVAIIFFGTDDWKGDLRTLNEMVKTKQSNADITERIDEFIRSHSNGKQLSYYTLKDEFHFKDSKNKLIFLD